jgi:hypothetical protein
MMRRSLAPATRAASMKVRCLRVRTWERTTRAVVRQVMRTMARMMLNSPGPRRATMMTAKGRKGMP